MKALQAQSAQDARFDLESERLGPLPLVNHFIDRIGLEEALHRHIPSDGRCTIPHARALGVLLRSLTLEDLCAGPGILGVKARSEIGPNIYTLHVARKRRKGRVPPANLHELAA